MKIKKKLGKIKKKIKEYGRTHDNWISRGIRMAIKYFKVTWRYLYCMTNRSNGLKDNKILFISHKGKQYSCNPMYICEYLQEKYPKKFEMVWAFNKPENFEYLKEKGITPVQFESKEYLRHLVSAKTVITNVDTHVYMPKNKKQLVIDTWHGGGAYKTCGFANPQNLETREKRAWFTRLYSRISLYCSSSKMFTEQTIRFSRKFDGEVLEVGMPRNDILVNRNSPEIEEKVRNWFGLDSETHIVLYAPTYRSAAEQSEIEDIQVEPVVEALKERFGGKWCCLFRAHHLSKMSADILSATEYPDMQELLYTADVLISDYSSSIWDFSLTGKPAFLYCPDLKKYTSSRSFYMPISQWPFILCTTNAELQNKIVSFDEAEYKKAIQKHHDELGNCESGHATEILSERIYKEAFGE